MQYSIGNDEIDTEQIWIVANVKAEAGAHWSQRKQECVHSPRVNKKRLPRPYVGGVGSLGNADMGKHFTPTPPSSVKRSL